MKVSMPWFPAMIMEPRSFFLSKERVYRVGKEPQPTNNRVRVGIIIASLIFGVAWAVIMILIGKN
jgi:hypothetical protein